MLREVPIRVAMQRHSVGPSIDATRRLALKGGASALVLSLFSVPTRAQDAPAGAAAPAAASPDAAQQSAPLTFDALSERMRQRAAESDLVIVNHHLLCADAAVRQSAYGEVIPGCAYAVIDEAHQLEDVATQYP